MDRRRILLALPVLASPLLVWGMMRLAAHDPPRVARSLEPPRTVIPARIDTLPVPPDVARLLADGRNWAAARRMRELVRADSSPGMVLLAARAEAGWGGWSNLRALLEGRAWLDRVEHGEGWFLLARARE